MGSGMEHMSRSSQQSQESRRVINISGVERVFEVRFVDFPDGMTEYVIGDEMDQARRCLRVDDYSGSTDGLPTDSWVLTLVAPGYGSRTLTRILDIPAHLPAGRPRRPRHRLLGDVRGRERGPLEEPETGLRRRRPRGPRGQDPPHRGGGLRPPDHPPLDRRRPYRPPLQTTAHRLSLTHRKLRCGGGAPKRGR